MQAQLQGLVGALEPLLQAAPSAEAKVAALLDAMNALQESRGGHVLQVAAGRSGGGGEALAADHILMFRATGFILGLADRWAAFGTSDWELHAHCIAQGALTAPSAVCLSACLPPASLLTPHVPCRAGMAWQTCCVQS